MQFHTTIDIKPAIANVDEIMLLDVRLLRKIHKKTLIKKVTRKISPIIPNSEKDFPSSYIYSSFELPIPSPNNALKKSCSKRLS